MRERFDSQVRQIEGRDERAAGAAPLRGPDLDALTWDDAEDRTMMSEEPAGEDRAEAGDEIAEAQLNLAMRLARLIDVLERLHGEAWAGAAVHTLLTRAREVESVSTAVLAVCTGARDWRVGILLDADAPLAEYLRGVVAWCEGIVRALDVLAKELEAGRPDFRAARRRIDDAASFHLVHLVDAIRLDARTVFLRPTSVAHRQLEELFWAASWLETTLTARVHAA